MNTGTSWQVLLAGALAILGASFFPAGSAVTAPAPPAEPWLTRGDEIETTYTAYRERLERFFSNLSAQLKSDAPDLLPKIKKSEPKPVVHGYQILPKLIPDSPFPTAPLRASVAAYSWPWTRTMIGRDVEKLEPLEADLSRIASLPPTERRAVYEKLATAFPALPKSQRLIDAHIRYNRLWQRSIAGNRAIYDRQTQLKDAVVERQTIGDALAAPDEASFRKELERLPAGADKLDRGGSRNEIEIRLKAREESLAREIHGATDEIAPLPFTRVGHPSPHRWIVHVPFLTDIEDRTFLRAFRSAVETTWHVVDGDDEYRVAVSFERLSPRRLYRDSGTPPPKPGTAIDLAKHLALFPAGAAVLTTGAVTTHVTAVRCIVIGPTEITPHVLAHEFGHILGFKDVYFRGYKDLGADGFQVEEIVAEPEDIMGGVGPVTKRQFERLIAAIAGK